MQTKKVLSDLLKTWIRSVFVALAILTTGLGCASTGSVGTQDGDSLGEAYAPREAKWDIRGTKLFVRETGPSDAPVLVVLHGGPGGNHLNLRPLEVLSPRFRVVLYDQRGTGASDRFDVSPSDPESMEPLRLQENVEDLEALREKLGVARITLIGHSWGGALAAFYAAAYPQRIDRLIVYSGGPEDEELVGLKRKAHMSKLTDVEKAQLKEGLGKLQTAVEGNATQDQLDDLFWQLAVVMIPSLNCHRPEQSLDAHGRAGFWANQVVGEYIEAFDRVAFAPKLQAIEAPALLMWGVCEPSPSERLVYLLDNLPDARLVVFEKSGHNAMEEEPELFFEIVRAFLADKPLPYKAYTSRGELPPLDH